MEQRFISRSPQQTVALGEALGRAAPGGLTIALVGPLGAGKTLLVKGIAIGNGVADPAIVTSPTFTLVQEYLGRLHLFHLDLYRLHSATELRGLGFDEMQRADSLVIVEWADKLRDMMPPDVLWCELSACGELEREIVMHGESELACRCVLAVGNPIA